MIEDVTADADKRMHKTIDALHVELAKIRTGRAHPSLLDHITVEYYGSAVPLSQAANVTVLDARTLSVVPWDKTMVQPIEKAIMHSDLGLNPNTSGTNIRVPLPALTEERRRELTKVVKHEGEEAKVAIRNIRRDANHSLKQLVKDKQITEDEERRAEEKIQKLTDSNTEKVDSMLAQKERELMEV